MNGRARGSGRTRAGDELPRERAFVLQLGATASARDRFAGRIEHVASGEAARFDSVEEAVAFVGRWIRDPLEHPRRRSRRNDAAKEC